MIFFKCFAVSTISPKWLIWNKKTKNILLVDINAELVNEGFFLIFNKMAVVLPKIRVLQLLIH